MSKLEDQVTPEELLSIIRGGTTKKDVVKQFKTSEQELAVMLLPLYRSRDLSMEEFNDFFKGVPLKPRDLSQDTQIMPARTEDEPPSQILRSLSARAEAEAKKKLAVVTAREESDTESRHTVEQKIEDETERKDEKPETDIEEEKPVHRAEAAVETAEKPKPAEEIQPLSAATDRTERITVQFTDKATGKAPVDSPVEPMEVRQMLQLILGKLSTIDRRLDRIEKSLKNT